MSLLKRLKRLFTKRKPTVYQSADQKCYHCGTWASRVGGWNKVQYDTPYKRLITMGCRWCDKDCVFVDIGVGYIRATSSEIAKARQTCHKPQEIRCPLCDVAAELHVGWHVHHNTPLKGLTTLDCHSCKGASIWVSSIPHWVTASPEVVEQLRLEEINAIPWK